MKYVLILIAMVSAGLAQDELATMAQQRGLKPIPKEMLAAAKKAQASPLVQLGKMLYFEPRLSRSGLISCNTCHNLGLGGTDGVAAAIGHKWAANPHHLNSPTVYNAVFNSKQFWDGRSPNLEDQATGPIQAGPEMAMPAELAVERIQSIPEYRDLFQKAFPEEKEALTFLNIGKAIAAFEETLITPSDFDAYLIGKSDALSEQEKKGLDLFVSKGCTTCHNGPGIGGSMMMKFPLIKPYKFADLGDFKGDANGLTKVPTLRNIEETAPYFHNGAVWSLNEAVKIMGETQLGIDLQEAEVEAMVSFLKALTGEKPDVRYPTLPPSSKSTPRPDPS